MPNHGGQDAIETTQANQDSGSPAESSSPVETTGDCSDSLWLEQPLDLVYREVNGQYFVTEPKQRQVIVLNESGFQTLRLCHGRTVGSVKTLLHDGYPSVDTSDFDVFLHQLQDHGLIVATAQS